MSYINVQFSLRMGQMVFPDSPQFSGVDKVQSRSRPVSSTLRHVSARSFHADFRYLSRIRILLPLLAAHACQVAEAEVVASAATCAHVSKCAHCCDVSYFVELAATRLTSQFQRNSTDRVWNARVAIVYAEAEARAATRDSSCQPNAPQE